MGRQIGIDIGGTHLRIGVVAEKTVISSGLYSSAEVFAQGKAVDALLSLIKKFVDASSQPIQAISIGIPGSVCNDHKTIYCTPNLFAANGQYLFEKYDLATPLQRELGIPVYISKDVNNLLRYDISARLQAQHEILLGAYIGTGYGTAVSLYGNLLEGAHGVAMDMGHMPLFHATQRCYCGKLGCVERYASGLQLIRLKDQFFPDTPFDRVFCEHCDTSVIEEFIYTCALPLATLAGAFDPHAIIIGGGVVEMDGFPREKLEKYILEQTPKAVKEHHINFCYSPNKIDKGVIGAALYAQKVLTAQGKDKS